MGRIALDMLRDAYTDPERQTLELLHQLRARICTGPATLLSSGAKAA